jgi:hypothetical protein
VLHDARATLQERRIALPQFPNRDCDLVRLPEPFVDLGDKPLVVGRPVMSTIAKQNRTRERSLAGATLKSNMHVGGERLER